MKKILIFLTALTLFSQAAFSQNKGDMYVGGNIGFGLNSTRTKISASGSAVSDKEPATLSFNIAPEFGYFVIDNLKVGASLGYGLVSVPDVNDERFNVSVFTIGPEVAYYIELAPNFYYTPQFGFYGAFGNAGDGGQAGFGFELDVLAFEFRPTQRLGFNIKTIDLSYVNLGRKENGVSLRTGTFKFEIGASLGVRYYF